MTGVAWADGAHFYPRPAWSGMKSSIRFEEMELGPNESDSDLYGRDTSACWHAKSRGCVLLSLSLSRRATAPIGAQGDLLAVLGSNTRQRTGVAIRALPSARGRTAVLDKSS